MFKKFRYKNLALFLIGILIAYYFVKTGEADLLAERIGDWGYFGSLLLGVMFSSSLTVGIATVFLFNLGQELNPYLVAIFGGAGAMMGDFIFYHFLKEKLFDELKELFSEIEIFPKKQLAMILRNEYFTWFIPSMAYLIILSPIPDEVGVGILSRIESNTRKLLIITFILNTLGIFLVVFIGKYFGG